MRKLRSDCKTIDIELASRMYHQEGLSLQRVSKIFHIHHTNLVLRFRRFGIPIKTKSEACRAAARPDTRGEKNHQWKGGYSMDAAGYVVNNSTKVRLHREIAAAVLGRPLKRNEEVHHIDGNKANNNHSNLVICNSSYHHWLHAKMEGFRIGIHKRGIKTQGG